MSILAAYSASRAALLTGLLKAEINTSFTRLDGTLLAGDGGERSVVIGEVAGRRLFGTPVGATVAGGTGTGGIGSITLGAEAKKGVYDFTCIATASGGGRFQVVDPDGYRLADLLVGVAYVHAQIECTIADGDPDFAVGDRRTITVPEGDLKLVPIDFDAVDGSQRFAGFFAKNTVAPDEEDAPTQILHRMCLVADSAIVWPDGATDGQKATVLAAAAERHIEVRQLA
ncbi:head decoration protein [Parvibaculum sp.]|uniref:head decoration protein n=1 Tax=Parvibaculum sp. TaxID=2024848 RepID=UPI0027301BBB|nr:head decoration protein [Parvibaculum sp.]MDP1628852.1 head decoration protein [Parvibaculum sp.]MDP2148247.1 head decoration protein [Parvibaculum sp.]MDP3327859.1 head decoration protein [Parvibaculum sp.]